MKILKIRWKTFVFLGSFLGCSPVFSQELKEASEVEKVIDKVIERSYHATVQITAFDTIAKVPISGTFSGVVVSEEGHILTAAHATRSGQTYKVTFPNGEQFMAIAYGRMFFGTFTVRKGAKNTDLSLLKFVTKRKWPYVEMGESANMKVGELCVGISSPATFTSTTPNIRLGRLSDVDYETGFFTSTCKMEPGDSGGALFDGNGKLIGIHSWIDVNEEINYEVPVDLYKKYWSALNVQKNYSTIPDSNQLKLPSASKQISLPPIQQLVFLSKENSGTAVKITSLIGDKATEISGTLISYNKFSKSRTYVVSKSSMIGTAVTIVLGGIEQKANVISRDNDNDLALLEVSAPAKMRGVVINANQDTLVTEFSNLGDLVISALDKNKQYISVLSTNTIARPRALGNFGANAQFIDKKITISNIFRGGSAEGILKLKDVITAVNGTPISKPHEYGEQVSLETR